MAFRPCHGYYSLLLSKSIYSERKQQEQNDMKTCLRGKRSMNKLEITDKVAVDNTVIFTKKISTVKASPLFCTVTIKKVP